jgi:predicted peroxiredoxin
LALRAERSYKTLFKEEGNLESVSEEQQEVHIVLVSNDPNRAYPALILALGTITMGAKCKLYCTMNGLDIVKKGGASKITMLGAPPLDKYLKDAIDAGVEVTACGPSKEMLAQMGITRDNLEQGVEFEDVIGFLKAALPAAKKGDISQLSYIR